VKLVLVLSVNWTLTPPRDPLERRLDRLHQPLPELGRKLPA
jgi:hypothetical protein